MSLDGIETLAPPRFARIAEVMRLIAEDCESDAMKLDGTPFTPRAVGEQFGNLLAAVKAVAAAVEALAQVADALVGAPADTAADAAPDLLLLDAFGSNGRVTG